MARSASRSGCSSSHCCCSSSFCSSSSSAWPCALPPAGHATPATGAIAAQATQRTCAGASGSHGARPSQRSRHSAAARRRQRGGTAVALLAQLALLALHATSAAAQTTDVSHLSTKVLGPVPEWVSNRTMDKILDFSKADPYFHHEHLNEVWVRGVKMKVLYHIGYYHGNVAIVRYGGHVIAAVRKMHFYKMLRTSLEAYPISTRPMEGEISWWASKMAVCSMDPDTLTPIVCEHYDPRTWKECLWNKGFEGTGVEDPRLIVWPGKGLFMMFGSKPWPKDPSGVRPEQTACDGPWAFQQFLVQLRAYGPAPPPDDPWGAGIIRLQYLAAPPKSEDELIKEKNWNPFIYKNELYFSQTFDPHVVIRALPNGTCIKEYVTIPRCFRVLASKPRGNTQAVLISKTFSGETKDYYLGIVHAEVDRSYQHFFYKMQAHPPFRIFAVSGPAPIINSQHPRNPVWTHVSFAMSLDLIPETYQVMIGYGSGDQVPHVKMLPYTDVLALFPPTAAAYVSAVRRRGEL